jgi:glycosyltransferase involved in cell wall biosynthesis
MKELITKLDILIIGQQAWDTGIGSNCKNIAIELSKTNRVLYVNSPLDRITRLKGRGDVDVIKRMNVIKGKELGLVEVQHNLWIYYPDCLVESINWINSKAIFDFFNKRNNKKFSRSISRALKVLSFEKYVLFNDGEMFKGFYTGRFLNPILRVYYVRDFLTGVPYWKKHGSRLEPLLIQNSDLCLCNSQYLTLYCREYNPNSFNIGQGVEINDLCDSKSSKPDDLEHITGKIIGYVGALSSARLNIGIMEHIALSFPAYSLVLIGYEDNEFRSSKLHSMSNVFFLGQKPTNAIPAYIKNFDVCINPQLINDITLGNYPRKIDEYLLFGKPVVATKTVSMEIFKDYVYLAETSGEYIELIQNAVRFDDQTLQERRIEFAKTHTWEKSVSDMFYHIQQTLSKHQF